jgi:DNA-binding PadR family transcriptional regulator
MMDAMGWPFGMPYWMAGRGGRGGRHGHEGFRRHGFFHEMFGGDAPRAERGGVRYLVLDAIATQPRHGYEIMQAIAERSGGTYRPSPGVIYPTLQMLEEIGHARGTEHDGRKVYAITDEGRKDLAEHGDEVADFYDRSGGDAWEEYAEDFGELVARVSRLLKTFRRAARHGRMSPARMRAVRAVIDEAMAKIEGILERER